MRSSSSPSSRARFAFTLLILIGGLGFAGITAAAPVLDSVTPGSGPTQGGTVLTLNGSGFGSSQGQVTVGGNACGIAGWSDTQVRCTSPAGQGTNRPVVVIASGPSSSNARSFSYAAPTVVSVTAPSAPTAGGTVVSITGTSFGSTSGSATIGGRVCTLTSQSHTLIRCTLPAGQGLAQAVVVVVAGQTSNGDVGFAYDPPTLTGLAPASGGTQGGEALVLTGTNFGANNGSLAIGGSPCAVQSQVHSQIVCTVPPGSGTRLVTVSLAGQTSNALPYRYEGDSAIPSLLNGWAPLPNGTSRPEVFVTDGVVHFKGAMGQGVANPAFVLPSTMWPAARVFVPVDLCNASPGRLTIETNGEVAVSDVGGGLAQASCQTSLDGAKFVRSGSAGTPLSVLNGWTEAAFGTSPASARLLDGIVYLKGGLTGGVDATVFVLPPAMRPAADVYVRIDLCDGRTGRLWIQPNGVGQIQARQLFTDAQCFSSLEGASFASASATGFVALPLEDGWTNAPFSTGQAEAWIGDDGIVRFRGAVADGTGASVTTLPSSMTPATDVYVPIDLCNAAPGRLHVDRSGHVEVETGAGLDDAQCFTSLDGVSFVPTRAGFQVLNPSNGWVNGTFSTQTTAVAAYDGIVHFKGALTGGTSATLFRLPVTVRPDSDVYVPVDLCGAVAGQIRIRPTGEVSVVSSTSFAAAQCFVSFEGASYVRDPASAAPLPLASGWIDSPLATSPPAATLVDGVVHLKGAMAGGSANPVFSLPPAMRPATDVYLPLGVAGGKKGRLYVQASGDAHVVSPSGFPDAQTFTSLDGVKFAPASATAFTPLSPLAPWTPSIYTAPPAATIVRDVVYLKGSIATLGGSSPAFALLPVLRPEGWVYVPIDLCGGTKGRLVITPTGQVDVVQLDPGYANAQCFTSLDGASYAVPEAAFLPGLACGAILVLALRGRRPTG